MKKIKNIIALLALSTISLPFAPLTSVKAATTPIQVQKETSNSSNSSKLNVSYSSITPTDATISSDTTGDTTTGTNPTSTVSVTVLSGFLTLEAVPDFNFGAMMVGSTGQLKNNTVDSTNHDLTAQDGNADGLLEVIDSRNQKSAIPGFSLSASMGSLHSSTSATDTTELNAILHLSSMPLLDGDKNNVSSTSEDMKTESATISSNKNTAQIMNLQAGTYNAGLISAAFNTPDSASLQVLNNSKATTSENSAKNMNAIITWTLTTTPVATN
ncbi:WxL domain-containing protein [Companilactobacillus crustorum]|uniref:WxL domain-containing protein n=1 Tax=Companilactobacillus crustorum TaxID=392416 RepID=UPI0009579A22|nr:WxL domain-containing protein [Companilactobacillus crustorum]APU70654.1 hypothetical protein BI355_0297 [Companilactobacillus crustorum]